MEALGDVHAALPAPWADAVLVVVSFLCGAAVGIERERQEKPAGLRTLILICVGSTIFTMASMSPALGVRDPARIAAQIVTGVGFLGAGSILRERHGIRGLTTAASIWSISAVGIVVGAGYAAAGFFFALAILFILGFVSRAEERLGARCQRMVTSVVYRPERGKTRVRIQQLVDERKASTLLGNERDLGDGTCAMDLEHCTVHREHRGVLGALAELPGVEGFDPRPPAGKAPAKT
jgi:putative Mg2+ transporter-C (MgtC) family protein